MNTFFSFTTISAILGSGAIEDCGGHCLGKKIRNVLYYALPL